MWNDLSKMSAKDLKIVAEWMGLVKWEDFQGNASAKEMLALIGSKENKEAPWEDQFNEALDFIKKCTNLEVLDWLTYEDQALVNAIVDRRIVLNEAKKTAEKEAKKIDLTIENKGKDNKYEVVTPVKRNGKILVKWDSIEFFEWIESLIKDWIVKKI